MAALRAVSGIYIIDANTTDIKTAIELTHDDQLLRID